MIIIEKGDLQIEINKEGNSNVCVLVWGGEWWANIIHISVKAKKRSAKGM